MRDRKKWLGNKKFALVLTHYVETELGLGKCKELLMIEKDLGFRSCFFLVAERYDVPIKLLNLLKRNGFGVGVHGLRHDGRLYNSREMFRRRSKQINKYLKDWDYLGFRSTQMQNNMNVNQDLE